MKDLADFTPFFTNYDFGIRKTDAKGNIVDWGASVSGSAQKGFRIFVMETGQHSSLLIDPVLFNSLHIAVQDNEQFYTLCKSITEEFPKLVKGL